MNWLRFKNVECQLLVLGIETLPKNIIACMPLDEIETFMDADQRTQFFGKIAENRAAYNPALQELCMAKMETGLWCRSVCIANTNEDLCKVYCFDYGIICNVLRSDIRVSNILFD